MELVNSVQETLTEQCNQAYFDKPIWPCATEHANSSDVDIEKKRHSSTWLLDTRILALLGKWSCTTVLDTTGFHIPNFLILDQIQSELHRRFDKSWNFKAVAACSPGHKDILKLTPMMPLIEECPDEIDVTNLESQLAVAQNLT